MPETVLGPQRRAPGDRHVLIGEHRQHAVADQFQHLAAGVMNGVDGSLRVIVEERDDLVGFDAFADRGRAAQVGKPQHCLDPLGDAARDFSAQHLFGGVAPEIDPAQGARDIHLRRRLDRKAQYRHEIAQRREILFAKSVVAPGDPIGIDAVHLAERAGLTEAVHEGDKVLVAFRREVIDHREIERCGVGEIEPQLLVAMLQHVEEGAAPPVPRRIAGIGRAILETVALVGFGVVPAKAAALEDRVQRIDEDEPARQVETARPAALAETADQVVLRQAGEALGHEPVHQAQAGRQFHEVIMPRNAAR